MCLEKNCPKITWYRHPIIFKEENQYNAWEMQPTTNFLVRKPSQHIEEDKGSSTRSVPKSKLLFLIFLDEKAEKENEFRMKKAQDGLKLNFNKVNIKLLHEIKERIGLNSSNLEENKTILKELNIMDSDPEELITFK